MISGQNHAFDFAAPQPRAREAGPAAPAGPARWTWSARTPAPADLASRAPTWDVIFGPAWRALLREALMARDAGESAEAVYGRMAQRSGHHPSTLSGFLIGAGLLRRAP